MAKGDRVAMMQKSMARMMRKKSSPMAHKEPDADEAGGKSDMDADNSTPVKFKRGTGSISSAGASVGGGT